MPSLQQRVDSASEFHRSGDYPHAMALYRECLLELPDNPELWHNYGVCLQNTGQMSEAVIAYKQSLSTGSSRAATWNNLGNTLIECHRHEEAIQALETAQRCEPENPHYLLNYAIALKTAARFEEALAALEKPATKVPEQLEAKFLWEKSLILLHMNRYEEAWPFYEGRYGANLVTRPSFNIPLWKGEDLRDKHLILIEEQGFGDTIFASRVVKLLAGSCRRISLVCRKPLHRLFESLPVDMLIDPGDPKLASQQADFVCHMMSVFGILGVNESNIPAPSTFTVPDSAENRFQFIGDKFKNKKKIGIVWSGNSRFLDNRFRAVSLKRFYGLLERPDIQVFSLQKEAATQELNDSLVALKIINLDPMLDDFADTAAAIQQLDLIVMTDSAVAHLAASLGKPVINLLHSIPFWVYGATREESPWYPTMSLIRQGSPGDWDSVFNRLLDLV